MTENYFQKIHEYNFAVNKFCGFLSCKITRVYSFQSWLFSIKHPKLYIGKLSKIPEFLLHPALPFLKGLNLIKLMKTSESFSITTARTEFNKVLHSRDKAKAPIDPQSLVKGREKKKVKAARCGATNAGERVKKILFTEREIICWGL